MKLLQSILYTLIVFAAAICNTYAQDPNPDQLLEQGQAELFKGNAKLAIELFNQCLKTKPSFVDAYIGRASSKQHLKDFAGALTDYSVALELAPENYDARLGRGNVFYKLGRYEEAKADYFQLLSLPPGETSTVYFQRSPSPTGTMQITTAQSDFRSAIYNYLGLTELKLKNFSAAKHWLDSAIVIRPREADYYVNRGLVLRQMNDANAVDDFKKALEINPQHTVALSALAAEGNTKEESTAYLDKAVESDTANIYPILERAYRRMEDGQYKEALMDYNAAVRLEDDNPETYLNRGFVKEKLNDLKGAYSDFTRAIGLRNDYAQAWLNRGNVLQKQGKLNEAMEDYSVALTYSPEYGAAYYNRAIVREKLKMKSESCSDLKNAEELGLTVNEKLKTAVCN